MAAVVGAAAVTCDENTDVTNAASTGSGQGGCPAQGPPEALFTVKVTAMRGALPEDTSLHVRWSAADEPAVVLNQPDSWKNENVVCDLPQDAGVPTELMELSCALWTSGVTEIEVSARGYLTHTETLTPKQIDGCEDPVPSEVEVQLVIDLDAGM